MLRWGYEFPPSVEITIFPRPKEQYFYHLMQRADTLEKTLMLGRLRAGGEGVTEDEMVRWCHQLNGHEFEQPWEIVKDKEARRVAVYGVAESQT